MVIIEATKQTTTLTDKETSYVHSLEVHSDEILDLYEDYNTSAHTLYNRIREIVINTNDKPIDKKSKATQRFLQALDKIRNNKDQLIFLVYNAKLKGDGLGVL
jgi:hypothetical protein